MKEEYIPYHRANLVAQLKRYAESAPKNLRNATIDQLKDEYSKYGITFYRSHSGKEKKYILELDLEHRLIVYSLDAARRISEKLNSIAKYVQESPDKDIGYPSYAHQEIIKQALSEGKQVPYEETYYVEIDTKGRFALLVTPPKKEEGKIMKRQYGVLAKFDGSPAMRPVWADARMCFLYDDETPTASQISTAWGLVADVLKYSHHDQEYQELTALLA